MRISSADQSSRHTLEAGPIVSGRHPSRPGTRAGRLLPPGAAGTLQRVLTEGKHRAESKKRLTPAVVIAPIAIIAIAVGAYVAFSRGSDDTPDGSGGVATTSAATPPFDFSVDAAFAVPTSETPVKKLRNPAKQAATNVAKTMSALYAAAFLDPENWRSGSYDAVWTFFEPTAADAARRETDDLTAGRDAGESFTEIAPDKGKLDVKVLFDERDKPAVYSAEVVFSANALAEDGAVTKLFSSGTYFLQPTSKGWRVTSFDVRRDDHAANQVANGADAPSAGATP